MCGGGKRGFKKGKRGRRAKKKKTKTHPSSFALGPLDGADAEAL